MLHVASVGTPCRMLLDVVAQSLKPVKLFSQQLPTFLLFRDRRSVAQQCWIRLHSSSNIVGATHAHYAWFTKTYGLYPSHDAVQVPTLLGVVATVCRPLPTRTQQLPILLAQQCWELSRPFVRSLINVWLLWTYSVTDTACRTPYHTCVTRILCAQEPWLLVCVKIFIYTIILTFCCYCFSLPWYRNIEEAVKLAGLPQHRQLPYATKQLIAREVTVLPLLTHLRLKIILEIQ